MAGPPYVVFPVTPSPADIPISGDLSWGFNTLVSGNFSILDMAKSAFHIYTLPTMGSLTIPVALGFTFTFLAMWVAHRNVRNAAILGILFGGGILFSAGSLGISAPVELASLGYGALLASVAGLVMSIFKNT